MFLAFRLRQSAVARNCKYETNEQIRTRAANAYAKYQKNQSKISTQSFSYGMVKSKSLNFSNQQMKKSSFILMLLLLFLFTIAKAQNKTADLIIINANIRTIDEKKPRAEAVAIAGNKISAVGTSKEIRKFIGKDTKTIDAGGKLVIPGFNDSHVHFLGSGTQFFSVNLRGMRTRRQIIEQIEKQIKYLPEGAWILGSGWDSENWSADDLPTREFIDAVTPDNPVFVYGAGVNAAFANSLALKRAGLFDEKKKITGGEIVRDKTGAPTGILKGRATLLMKVVAKKTDKSESAQAASNYAAAFGVTSIQEVSAEYDFELYRGLAAEGKLKTRVYDCAGLEDWKKLADAGIRRAYGDAFVRSGCLKSYVNGNEESAARLLKFIPAADRADLQIMIHAIGSGSNETILNVFEKTIKQNGIKDRRFRVEHAHGMFAADIKRFAKGKIIASMQPALFFGGVFNDSEPYRSLLNENVSVAFGSDTSMIPITPFDGVYAAVMTGGDGINQSISVEEAVRAYTLGSAYAEFQENVKGTISVGKLADMIILSDDMWTIKKEEIPKVKVLTTIVDGKIVYENKD